MARALYDPVGGYYATGEARVGRAGDFFTSVSVGPLFGALLAREIAGVWEKLGRPAGFTVVEQGANDGQLSADVRAGLPEECRRAVRWAIIEPLAALREKQRARLGDGVAFYDAVEALPRFVGVHFSNELLDAFPTHRVVWRGAQWRELGVAAHGEGFQWCEIPHLSPGLDEALRRRGQPEADGFTTEVCLAAPAWVRALSARMERGLILAADYGLTRADFLHPMRPHGTLAAYRAHHRVDDPLAAPGQQDLTAHVDFTALAEAAIESGLELAGYCDQHHYIVGLARLHFPDGTPPDPRAARAFRTLMHPDFLGRGFKVCAFTRGLPADALAGFHFATDARRALGL